MKTATTILLALIGVSTVSLAAFALVMGDVKACAITVITGALIMKVLGRSEKP